MWYLFFALVGVIVKSKEMNFQCECYVVGKLLLGDRKRTLGGQGEKTSKAGLS